MRISNDQTCGLNTAGNRVTLEKVIAHKQCATPTENGEMTEPCRPIVADFHIVDMSVDCNRRSIGNGFNIL